MSDIFESEEIVVTGVWQPGTTNWYILVAWTPTYEPPLPGQNDELPPDNGAESAMMTDEELLQLCEDHQDKSWFQDFVNSLDRNPSGIDHDGDGDSDYNDYKRELELWWSEATPVEQALYGVDEYIAERDRRAAWGAVFDAFQGDNNNSDGGG